jgi:hypothetical protein
VGQCFCALSELKYYSFVETAVFSKQLDSKASLDVLYAIQNDLIADPKRGDVVRGSGGVRKARVGDARGSRGKRGRYLYLYLEQRGIIYLLYFYGKDEQSDLSSEQKKRVGNLARMIKEASE